MKTHAWKVAFVAAVAAVGPAGAQVLDLQTGSSANILDAPRYSVEGGVVAGDVDYIGARGNFRLTERLAVGVDLGSADIGDDEMALGGFAIYQLDVGSKLPVAIKAGYAMIMDGDVDFSDLSLQVVVSGEITDRVSWYANAGIHRVDVEVSEVDFGPFGPIRGHAEDDDIAPALGGGFVFTITDQASAYVGVDLLLGDIYDDTVIGGGFRWSFE
jgi:hypothetical protein